MEGGLETSQIEEILLKDPHVIAIHHPKDFARVEINESLWGDKWESVHDMLDLVWWYLETPSIAYDFTNLVDRRVWKNRLEDQLYDYVENDSLRSKNVIVPFLRFRYLILECYTGPDKPQLGKKIKELGNLYVQVILDVSDPVTQKGIDTINRYKDKIYEVLEFLGSQTKRSLS